MTSDSIIDSNTTGVIDYTQSLPIEIMCLIAEFSDCPLALEMTSRRWRNIVRSLRHKYPWNPKRAIGFTWNEACWNLPRNDENLTMRLVAAAWHGNYDEICGTPYLQSIWCSPMYQPFPKELDHASGTPVTDAILICAALNGHINILDNMSNYIYHANITRLSKAATMATNNRNRVIAWLNDHDSLDIVLAIKAAVKRNDFETTEFLMSQSTHPSMHQEWTPICNTALRYGHVEFVKTAISKNINLCPEKMAFVDRTMWITDNLFPGERFGELCRVADPISVSLKHKNTKLATRLLNAGVQLPSNHQLTEVICESRSIDVINWTLAKHPHMVFDNPISISYVGKRDIPFLEALLTNGVTLSVDRINYIGTNLLFVKWLYSMGLGKLHNELQYRWPSVHVLEWLLDFRLIQANLLLKLSIHKGDIDTLTMLLRKGYIPSEKQLISLPYGVHLSVIRWALKQPVISDDIFTHLCSAFEYNTGVGNAIRYFIYRSGRCIL